ncbi:MAG: CAP domain-containing protein [Planctomycetota bacterium]|nr:CAP domain-containing protein [Planctomycetota bacterium]
MTETGRIQTTWLIALSAAVWAVAALPAAGQLRIPPKAGTPPATAPAPGASAGDKKPALDARRETLDLPVQFRKKKGDAEGRKAVVDRAIELGGQAPAAVLAAVQAEMTPLAARYRQAFYKEAQQKVRAQLKDSKPQDIDAHRQAIMAAVNQPDLAKETIVEKADPALKQLQERLLVSPEAVLAGAEALQKMRDELAALGQFADRLTEALPAAGKAAGAPAPARSDATLRADEEVAALMVIAADDKARKVLLDNLPLEAKIQPEEAKGIRFMNQVRILAGLAPCAIDTRLCDAARDHSKDMVEKKFFAHESPVPGKSQPWDRAKNFGTSANAENIASGASTGLEAIMQWWHSPGHLKNMMASHSRAGLGNYQKTWTQMFGG